jgi:hypothetical protein
MAFREKNGETGGARTRDHKLKRLVLYQLSYRPTISAARKSLPFLRSSRLPHKQKQARSL